MTEKFFQRERFSHDLTRCLGILLIVFCAACATTPEAILPSATPVITTGLPTKKPFAPFIPTITVTPDETPTSFVETDTPEPSITLTDTPTEGVYSGWPNLTYPTITAMAGEVAKTMDAHDQLELAQQELPAWYISSVVSIVFRNPRTRGYTSLRLDAQSFTGENKITPGYAYYLMVDHAYDDQRISRTVSITDTNGLTDTVSPAHWIFQSDNSGMAILAVRQQKPSMGVSISQFENLDQWDPQAYLTSEMPVRGLCFPYPDYAHAFETWFFTKTLDGHSLFRYGGLWQIAILGDTAGAASGCPVVTDKEQKIVAIMEGIYPNGGRATPIDTAAIANLILRIK